MINEHTAMFVDENFDMCIIHFDSKFFRMLS